MKCPIDPTVELIMTDRQGVEIDYCPTCRGVWLDRGELDKLIERSTGDDRDDRRRDSDDRDDRRRDSDDRDDRYRDSDDRRPGTPYKKKKSSFLGELFDF